MIRLIAGTLAMIALAAQPASYRDAIATFRQDRIKEVAAEDGWLAVRGLFWLHEGANIAGSDPASAIRLPASAPSSRGVTSCWNRSAKEEWVRSG